MTTVDGTPSHCPYCALQCAMTITLTPAAAGGNDAPVTVAGRDFPTNRGGLCKKGWTSAELLARPDRIRSPLHRTAAGEFEEVGWDRALEEIASTLKATRAEAGADAIGIFGGGGLTNEKAYTLGKFARVGVGTSRIDYNGRFCMSSAAAAGIRAFGLDRGLPFRLDDLDIADTVLLLGSNVAATMPPFVGHLEGARANGGLIVVDPRRSATARLTDDGHGTHVQVAPGTDLILLLGLAHIVIAESLIDETYLTDRTAGYDAVRLSTAEWWPERVQGATGVPGDVLRAIARRLAGGSGVYILTGRGVEQHVDGTDTATAAINLALLLGLPGSTHSGYGTLTGQGNGQGGREHGQKADQLPGYRKIDDPAARAHVAGVWGVDPAIIPGPGVPALKLLAELGSPGGVRNLLVHGSNIVVSAPDSLGLIDRLGRLDMLVVCDFFFSETAALADWVLPVRQWAEEEGTMTNLEGRVLRRRAAIPAPDDVRDELWIFAELARLLDSPASFATDPSEVFAELGRASAGGPADYSGIEWDALTAGAEAYWPYPTGSTGTPRMFLDSFAHPGGRARLVPVRAPHWNGPSQHAGVLTLITGRLLEHYQSGAQTRRVPELTTARPEATAQLHPATARGLGVTQGAIVEVHNSRGTVTCRAELTADIRHDTVFLPFHFAGGQSANILTEAVGDPISGMPEFKRTIVSVRSAELPLTKQRVQHV